MNEAIRQQYEYYTHKHNDGMKAILSTRPRLKELTPSAAKKLVAQSRRKAIGLLEKSKNREEMETHLMWFASRYFDLVQAVARRADSKEMNRRLSFNPYKPTSRTKRLAKQTMELGRWPGGGKAMGMPCLDGLISPPHTPSPETK